MKTLNVAITGFGNVGSHIAQLLWQRQATYRERYGVDVRLVGVCRSRAGILYAHGLQAADLVSPNWTEGLTGEAFLQALQADVLIETGTSDFQTGGMGLVYLRHALRHNMQVIAVSKGALALHGRELFDTAKQAGLSLLVSGATAAALPTVDFVQRQLAGCEVLAIEGIFTGTANFILNQMMHAGIGFDEALQQAQADGIAEADSSFDTDGWDTAAKITIIANALFNTDLTIHTIARAGMAHLQAADMAAWRAQGLMPRLIGHITVQDGKVSAGVAVRAVDAEHVFYRVNGKNKAMQVVTREMGALCVQGGASSPQATAAATLKDLENLLKQA
ncbi:homoserine dehydrogenase [Vitreoscilla massiliensis]|uniref:Homoserine dehydrogenase n=1 Tax=Vitreoscilla massiliensis TaxID=1689272 RepID=A0ABY4E7Y6_9NEIS|nr:homoserine dehydrogenase [Vitreoscilla massiliensis]UOO90543.1 homoserine dehydrogenase [Vitreoscilla massiliensis]